MKSKPTWLFIAAFIIVILLPLKFKQNEKNANVCTGNITNSNHCRVYNPDTLQYVAVTDK